MKKTKKLKFGAETVRILGDAQTKIAAGGYTNTCLGTACQCFPTYGPDCPSVGFTLCICSIGHSNCPQCGGGTISGTGC